jgi:hypothetical protein|tara:strand:- start:2359 stop:2484 length:126 start_codon:yes stop_codon:yes gene_type:complete
VQKINKENKMKIAGICSKHGYYKGEKCPKCKKEERKDDKKM